MYKLIPCGFAGDFLTCPLIIETDERVAASVRSSVTSVPISRLTRIF
nr:MAG TPA: hypothetical protein [Caudoviricetes sp.]